MLKAPVGSGVIIEIATSLAFTGVPFNTSFVNMLKIEVAPVNPFIPPMISSLATIGAKSTITVTIA